MSTTATIPNLQELLTKSRLPALPQTAVALLRMSQNPDATPVQYTRIIESDPGLVGQVLRFVNSSYFGFSREIASIQQALTLVGVRQITNFALWSAVFALVPNPKFGPFDLKSLWLDSLRRAAMARSLGRKLKLPNADDLFAGALLQDMAIPLLIEQLPEHYQPLVERRSTEQRRLSELERETLGWDHAEAAAGLVRQWKLPESFAQLVEHHTNLPALLAGGAPQRGAACVALASMLPSCRDDDWTEIDGFAAGFRSMTAMVPVNFEEIVFETDQQTKDFAPLLKLPLPRRTLAEWIA
jgi:HD-like signal output (HDOD) protein